MNNRFLTMFAAVVFTCASILMLQAEVVKGNIIINKHTSSVAKEANQAKPTGELAFLGIHVEQSKDQLTTQLKKKGFQAKKDANGTPMLSGNFEGRAAKIYVDDNCINIYDVKKYSFAQGKVRFNALVSKMKLTYGNGTLTSDGEDQKIYNIKNQDGEVEVWLCDEDEVNFDSGIYIVNVIFKANSKPAPIATVQEEEDEEDGEEDPLDNRFIVFVEHFLNNSKVDNITVKNLRQEIMTGITNSRRIRVLDAANYTDKELPSLFENKNERIQVIVCDSTIKLKDDKGKTVTYRGKHAQFYLLGTLNSIDSKEMKDKEGKITYKANVNFTLTLNNKQNITIGANTFNENYEGDTGEEAILRAIGKAGNRMRKFVDAYFPIEGKIIDVDEKDERKENKKAVKSCYVSVGKADGIVVGDILEVFMEKEIVKKLVRKKIGEVKADEVMSDEITHCVVKNGGIDIYKYFFDEDYKKSEYNLWVVSRPKKTINLSDDVEETGKSAIKKTFDKIF